ncbi:MAG: hypothetical protein SGJ04_08955 [Bacteroidota bacterium]|nr:hypothetical protein [Bacteroidota bacterium]
MEETNTYRDEQIENYLLGNMSQVDRESFERQINNDDNLAKEVEINREIINIIASTKRQDLRTYLKTSASESKNINSSWWAKNKYLSLAASVLVLLGLSVIIYSNRGITPTIEMLSNDKPIDTLENKQKVYNPQDNEKEKQENLAINRKKDLNRNIEEIDKTNKNDQYVAIENANGLDTQMVVNKKMTTTSAPIITENEFVIDEISSLNSGNKLGSQKPAQKLKVTFKPGNNPAYVYTGADLILTGIRETEVEKFVNGINNDLFLITNDKKLYNLQKTQSQQMLLPITKQMIRSKFGL